ncbi:hypothetical protein D3C78_1664310 [compost metagenome]
MEIWGLPARLSEAVSTKAERAAGLAERLGVTSPAAPVIEPAPAPDPGRDQDQLSLF